MKDPTALQALIGLMVFAVVAADRYWPRRQHWCQKCAENAVREALEQPRQCTDWRGRPIPPPPPPDLYWKSGAPRGNYVPLTAEMLPGSPPPPKLRKR